MLGRRFLAIATTIRVAMAAFALAWAAWPGGDEPRWVLALLLAGNLALDVIGGLPTHHWEERPLAGALTLASGKALYGLLFILLALPGHVASWLALAMVAREVAVLAGAIGVWRATGRVPAPSVHERWPVQILIGAIALSVAGVPGLQPVVYLLFALALTRLPGFWFRFCDLLDPHAYHPELPGEPGPAAAWPQALRAALAHPSTRLTLFALPAGLLAAALGAVWLAGRAAGAASPLASLAPSANDPAMAPMVRLLARGLPAGLDWTSEGGPVLTFALLLPLALLLPDLVGMHLREVTLHRPAERPGRLCPGLFTAGMAATVGVAFLAAYWLGGLLIIGPPLVGALWHDFGGGAILLIDALLLSILVVSYPGRFPHEPPLYRLEVAGGSLSTPCFILMLAQLLGLFSPGQGGVAIAVMLPFAAIMTHLGYVRAGVTDEAVSGSSQPAGKP